MTDSKELGALLDEIKSTAGDMRANISEYKGVKAKVDDLAKELHELVGLKEAVALLQTKFGRPGAPNPTLDAVEGQSKAMAAFNEVMRKWHDASSEAKGALMEATKAFNVGTDTAGGYTVPPEFVNQIIEKQAEMNPILGLAWKMGVSREVLQIPKESGNPTAVWIGDESSRGDTQNTWAVGLEEVKIGTIQSRIDVSNALLEDSAFALEQFFSRKIAVYQDKAIGKALLDGSGTKAPEGMLTNGSVSYVAGGSASAITSDGMIDLWGALPTSYDKGAVYIMNKQTQIALRKLKDGQNQYLWQPALTQGMPPTFNGIGMVLAGDMPAIAGNAYPVLCGDLQAGYLVAQRQGMVVVKDNLTQRGSGLSRFYFEGRLGGQVVNAEAIKKLKISTT